MNRPITKDKIEKVNKDVPFRQTGPDGLLAKSYITFKGKFISGDLNYFRPKKNLEISLIYLKNLRNLIKINFVKFQYRSKIK